jgi:homoserine kinase
MINNCTQGGSLVAAILMGDAALLGAALDSDVIVEPVRAPLIPGMLDVKAAAKAAGKQALRPLKLLRDWPSVYSSSV